MKKKMLAALMIATLCLAGCQSSTQADTPVATPTVTTAPTEAPKPTEEIAPTEEAVPTEVVAPTEEVVPTEVPVATEAPEVTEEPVITEEPAVEPTEEPLPTVAPTSTPLPTATTAPTATPEPTATPVPTATPTPEPTATPVPTATPKPTMAPDLNVEISDNILWEGKEYVENEAGYGPHNGTITLSNIGTKIPLLPAFNEFGIDKGNKGWIGKTADEEGILHDVLEDVALTLIRNEVSGNHSQLFLYTNYCISFSYTTGTGSRSDIHLDRDPTTDTYTLTINRDLQSDYLQLMRTDYAPYNRDMVKVFLSIFSSTPEELFDAIYDTLYGDDDMPISLNTWDKIDGVDCLGRVNYDACQKGHYVFEFKAK